MEIAGDQIRARRGTRRGSMPPGLVAAQSLLALALAGCAATTAADSPPPGAVRPAGPPPLVTDRPDRTESSSTVDPGRTQLEWGWTRTHDDDGGVEATVDTVSEALLRHGLAPDLELRLGFAGFIAEEMEIAGASPVESDAGAGDGEIGAKWRWLHESESVPEVALIGGITLPTGAVGSPRADPSLVVAISKDIAAGFGAATNLGVSWESEEQAGDDSTLSSFDYSFVVGADITEAVGGYLEYFGDAGLSRDGGPANTLAAGVTWLLAPNLQLDLSGGAGLSEDAEDRYVAIGFSYRFPD